MAIAFDAISNATPGTGNLSWTHTPVGTPRGVLVFVIQNVGTTDEVTSVTYGGTTMTQVSGSPNLHTTGEPGGVHAFYLGSNVLTGARTVSVTVSGSSTKAAVCITVTAAANVTVQDSDATINSDSLGNPSVTLSHGGYGCFDAIGFHSGVQQPSGITPLTDWTTGAYEYDFGSQNAGVYYYSTVDTADVTAGWSQSADDAAAIAVALREDILLISGAGNIGTAEAHGTATIGRGAVTVSPSGIGTAQAFGTPALSLQILPTGIVSTEGFGTTIVSGAQSSAAKIKSNQGHLVTGAGSGKYARAIAYATDKSDVEVYADFTWEDIAAQGAFRVFLRTSRDWNTDDKPTRAYELVINNDGGYVINRIQAGSRTQIGTGAWTASTSPGGFRFQTVGTDVRAKVWTGTEPGAWNTEIDDSISGFTTAGSLQLGLFWVSGSSHSILLDNLTYDDPTVEADYIFPSGIVSDEAFGSATITTGVVDISPSGIATGEGFGTATVGRGVVFVAPSGIATVEAHGTATIGRGVVFVVPSGIGSSEAFGAATIGRGAVNVSPSGIATAEAFGTATLTRGVVNVSPSGIATAQAFGTLTVGRGAVNLSPSGISTAEAFGTASVTVGAAFVSPTGISSAEAFGNATVSAGISYITPSGIDSAEVFGTTVITTGVVAVTPTGIASAQAMGSPTVLRGAVNLSPSGISSAQAFGTAKISLYVLPSGVGSQEQVGTAVLLCGAVNISPAGILSGEAFGTSVLTRGAVNVSPSSISSGQAFGNASLTTGAVTISVTGIATGQAFGTPTLHFVLYANGIGSSEAFGTATLSLVIFSGSIASSETFGLPEIYGSLAPDGDVSIGGWTDQNGGTTNLYAAIDEPNPDDADYVKTDVSGVASDLIVSLDNIDDPGIDTDHKILYRYKQEGVGTVQLTVYLFDGANMIASWSHGSIGGAWVDAEQTLSNEEAASINDYNNLRLKFSVVEV